MIDRHTENNHWSLLEITGALVALCVMGVYAFTVLAPYFFSAQAQAGNVLEIIKSNQSTVNIITTAVVMFYFGASVGRRKDQDTLSTMAHTTAKQVAQLAPVVGAAGDGMVLPVGATAKLEATDAGTEIKPEP